MLYQPDGLRTRCLGAGLGRRHEGRGLRVVGIMLRVVLPWSLGMAWVPNSESLQNRGP